MRFRQIGTKLFLALFASLISPLFFPSGASAVVKDFSAEADAGTKSQFPNTNFGSGTYLYNYYNSGNKGRSFIKFDISSIPANSTIVSSSVYVYNMANDASECNGDPGLFYLSLAGSAWSESTITWNNQPSSISNLLNPIPCTNGYISLDSKYIIQEIVNGNKTNNGFFIVNEVGTNFLRSLLSRESPNPPRLNVLYNPPVTPTPTPDPGGGTSTGSTSQSSTSSTSITQNGISAGTNAAPSAKTTKSIKPPTEVKITDAATTEKAIIKLGWKVSESAVIDGYKIFRSENEKDGFQNIAIAKKDITEFLDETVTSGKTYYYFLRSYKGTSESESTSTVNLASTILPATTNPTQVVQEKTFDIKNLYILLGASALFLASLLVFYELNWKKKKIKV